MRVQHFFHRVWWFLHQPFWVFMLCLLLMSTQIIFDGTLWHIYSLSKNRKVLEQRMSAIQTKNHQVEENLKKLSSDSTFLEKEAVEEWNLVGKKDLIFIFPEEDP